MKESFPWITEHLIILTVYIDIHLEGKNKKELLLRFSWITFSNLLIGLLARKSYVYQDFFSWFNFFLVLEFMKYSFWSHFLMFTAWYAMDFTAELRQTIRQEMENNRNCNDKQKIRFLISEGLERLKGLDEMLDMQGRC